MFRTSVTSPVAWTTRLILLMLMVLSCTAMDLEEVFKWRQIGFRDLPAATSDFTFQSNGYRAAPNNSYNAYNNVPMGVTHHNGILYVTVPRRRPGIPSTLNYIDLSSKSNGVSPLLRSFPDFATNRLDERNLSPDRLVSVYRTKVDACNRMWFVDTGMLEYPNNRQQLQRPSLWAIDLTTRQRVVRFEIPESIVATGNGLPSVAVDVEADNCDAAFVYLPDIVHFRIHVYSLAQRKMWQFIHNSFSYDPLHGDFNVAGMQYQWRDGVFSITLGPRQRTGFKSAYYHAMSAITEFVVSTQVLRNETAAARSYHFNDFALLGWRQPMGQSAMHDYDETTGILFYAEVGRNAIGCWNSKKQFKPENHGIVFQDDERMVYPSDMSVDRDGVLWAMSNTMPRFIYARLNENDFNFRIA